MKAQDLRIGNWFKNDSGKAFKVTGSTLSTYEAVGNKWTIQINPIKLTPEILENAGFERCEDGDYYRDEIIWSLSARNNFLQVVNIPDCVIEYLHELQNLYFAVTGDDLKVEFK